MNTTTAPLPTRKSEQWRYGNLKALERVWDRLDAPERIDVPAGERMGRVIEDLATQDGVGIVDLDVHVGDGGRLDLFCLLAAAEYGRVKVKATLGRGAHFELGGAIIASGDETLEIVTETVHAEPEGSSNQTVRAVLANEATGSFLGAINVARHAQKTDAAQSFKAMLLDRSATANAKPELEIFADDVKCAHGATVGELDQAAMFYMASRGLPPERARQLMLRAFLADAFVGMDDSEAIEEQATEALEKLI